MSCGLLLSYTCMFSGDLQESCQATRAKAGRSGGRSDVPKKRPSQM